MSQAPSSIAALPFRCGWQLVTKITGLLCLALSCEKLQLGAGRAHRRDLPNAHIRVPLQHEEAHLEQEAQLLTEPVRTSEMQGPEVVGERLVFEFVVDVQEETRGCCHTT